MLLVLQMTVQLVGVMRISLQVQRMELFVFVPLFHFQGRSQRVFAVPKFSSKESVLQCAMNGALHKTFSWSVEVVAQILKNCGFRCARALQLSLQFFEHGASGGTSGCLPLHLRVLC